MAPPGAHGRAALLAGVVLGWMTGWAADARCSPFAGDSTDAPGARLRFASDGGMGAWLVAALPDGSRAVDEEHLQPRLDDPLDSTAGAPRWRLASAADGAVHVDEALEGHVRGIAYAGGVVHVPRDGRYVLLLGAEGGVEVRVDGHLEFTRDGGRPGRNTDDLVALDLSAGDHAIVLGLRRRLTAPGVDLRARLLDEALQPPPGAAWSLPGSVATDAASLATRMATATLDRGMTSTGYEPVLTVEFREGIPAGSPVHVQARLAHASPAAGDEAPLF